MGGLNANIILGGTPAPAPQSLSTPAQQLDALAKIQQYQQQRALAPLQQRQLANNVTEQDQKIQNYSEDQADHAAWQQAFNDSGGDYDKTRATVAGTMHARNLQAYDRDHLTNQQALTSLHKSDLDNIKTQNELGSQELAAVMAAPDEQKGKLYSAGLAKMAKLGIDVSGFPQSLPDDPDRADALLKSLAGKVGYTGQLVRDAQRKQNAERAKQQAALDEQKADNALEEENAKKMQRKIEAATSAHVGVTNQAQHDAWLKSLDPDVRAKFTGLEKFDPNATPKLIQQKALTTLERTQQTQKEAAQATADAREAAYQKNLESLTANRIGDGQKPMKPNQAIAIEKQKDDAIASSKRQLDKELAAAKSAAREGEDEASAVSDAWNNHISRIQDAQNAYEGKIGAATGNYPEHNDWADKLKAPEVTGAGGSGRGGAKVATPPPANPAPAAPVVPPAAPPATPAAAPAARTPLTQSHPIGSTMYGQDGKLYTITGYDKTGKVLTCHTSPSPHYVKARRRIGSDGQR